MIIKTTDTDSIKRLLHNIRLPAENSHKGQNGKMLIIGGSHLFHAASLWSAEVASHLMDMVHYCSTVENEEIFLSLKKKFRNGMVVQKKDLLEYVKEDDVILIGPGMVRGSINTKVVKTFEEVIALDDEPSYTFHLTKFLVEHFPDKKFVIDAGALQMMDPSLFLKLTRRPLITPHQLEFEKLFGVDISSKNTQEKIQVTREMADKYHCVILLKAVEDFISDGKEMYIVEGGNAGLTKGGTGDILASLAASFFAKNDPLESAVIGSYLLKKTADQLFKDKGYWYNINNIIEFIPHTLKELFFNE